MSVTDDIFRHTFPWATHWITISQPIVASDAIKTHGWPIIQDPTAWYTLSISSSSETIWVQNDRTFSTLYDQKISTRSHSQFQLRRRNMGVGGTIQTIHSHNFADKLNHVDGIKSRHHHGAATRRSVNNACWLCWTITNPDYRCCNACSSALLLIHIKQPEAAMHWHTMQLYRKEPRTLLCHKDDLMLFV